MTSLRISEHFYSIQGEGATVGVPAIFVRFQGCNLCCGNVSGTWRCDTIEVWMSGTRYSIVDWHQIFMNQYESALKAGAHIVITGGEPLLQQSAILTWLDMFESPPFVEIETNGTILPSKEWQSFGLQWNVSLKLSNSGEPCNKRVQMDAIGYFKEHENVQFKFVVATEDDVIEVLNTYDWVRQIPIAQKKLMPAADTKQQLNERLPWVINWAKQYGFSVSHRLHIALWNQKTGV